MQSEATRSGEWCFDDVACHPAVELGGIEYPVVACRHPTEAVAVGNPFVACPHDSEGSSRDDFIVRDVDGNHRLIIFDVDGHVVVDKPYFLPNL